MPKKLTRQIRIIGGKWRSRKILFPALAEIRPTADRVRETLFNWLSPFIADAYCLDVFAGSGALGFEALSRGARHVVMVDKSPLVIEHLRDSGAKLNTQQFTLYQTAVPSNIVLSTTPFDIIFLDPPFHHHLLLPTLEWLQKQHLLHAHSLLYVETENKPDALILPPSFNILKSGKTSQVLYYLTQLTNS